MQKRTHKLRVMRKDAEVALATTSTVSAAARKLGVSRQSLHAWIRNGKIRAASPAPSEAAGDRVSEDAPAGQSPEAWARSVHRKYRLTASEGQMVRLAVRMLKLAHAKGQPAAIQVSATARAAVLVRQINAILKEADRKHDGRTQETEDITEQERQWPRRVG